MDAPRLTFFALLALVPVCCTFGAEYKDPCLGYYCANGGSCVRKNGCGPTCECAGAWTGKRCDDNPCVDVNCNNGTCYYDGNGSPHCSCPLLTSGEFCEVEENPCDNVDCNNGTCNVRTDGSTICLCPDKTDGDFCELFETCNNPYGECKEECAPNETHLTDFTCFNGRLCCYLT